MATSPRRSDLDEQQLIEKYIDLDFSRTPYGRSDAWLRHSHASIWAIVYFNDQYNGDREELARHFGISREEIDAAFAYYRRYKKYVDAQILVNDLDWE
jgi:uncharacterized protein (DUF433 family)